MYIEDREFFKKGKDYRKRKKHVIRKETVIGVSLPTLREKWWVKTKEALENEAKLNGVTLKIEIADFDKEKQVQQIKSLISQGIDVLIFVPLDAPLLPEVLKEAKNAGIKLISYGVIMNNSDVDLFIDTNVDRIGQLQGRYLIEKVPKGNYVILEGGIGGENLKNNAMEYIQPLVNIGNIKIVADKVVHDWEPNLAYGLVEEALTANNNKVNAILAPNDAIAGAAIEVLQHKGLAGKVAVTGLDAELPAIKRIIEGTQLMTVFFDVRTMAKAAIDASIKLVNGDYIGAQNKLIEGNKYLPTIQIDPVAIDKNNIDKELIKSGYYSEKEIYTRKYR